MATFKAFIVSALVIFLLSQCKQSSKNTVKSPALPQMSKEEGQLIITREINVWEYSKTKQYDKLREILADDYIGYFNSGNMQPSDVINLLRKTTFNDYHLSKINVKPIAEDVAIIYYDVAQEVVGVEGDKWIPEISASSVYAKRNGIWYSTFYQEMPMK
ncbi:MAG: nuclear transport factor 2 family protein [Ferruginibacter sp.]